MKALYEAGSSNDAPSRRPEEYGTNPDLAGALGRERLAALYGLPVADPSRPTQRFARRSTRAPGSPAPSRSDQPSSRRVMKRYAGLTLRAHSAAPVWSAGAR